jgi:DNA-binding MarR family transcriptional regulator
MRSNLGLWPEVDGFAKLVATATILNPWRPFSQLKLERFLAAARDINRRGAGASRRGTRLDLFRFAPFRLNRLAAEVSSALASEYQTRYGLDIPEWRVLATLGFRNDACSAQYISDCTRTHKSTISRAVTALLKRHLVERVENEDDRREFRLRITRKGKALYEELIPRLKRKEQAILSCLSAKERKDFADLLGKIERSLDLVQTSKEADAKEAY